MRAPDVARMRLLSQGIAGSGLATSLDVVRRLGALQAQDYGQSLWAVGVRTDRCTAGDVEDSIARGQILRTWPMRGTIHLVPAEDAGWMLQLGAARKVAGDRRRMEQLELDESILARCSELLADELCGQEPVARGRLMQRLEADGVRTTGQRGYHVLWRLAQAGLICLGPVRDKEQTFVLLEEWVPSPRSLGREEALAELAGRYFVSRGPATASDFATWSGLTLRDARAGIEALGERLARQTVEGVEHWLAADAVDEVAAGSGGHLLPGFDELLLGDKDRSAVLAPEHATRVVPGGNGIFFPMVVVDGSIVGTWKRTLRKGSVDLVLQPFPGLPGAGDLVERVAGPARTYADFLGVPLGAVAVGS